MPKFRVFYRLSKNSKLFMNVYAKNEKDASRSVVKKLDYFQHVNNDFQNIEIICVEKITKEAV